MRKLWFLLGFVIVGFVLLKFNSGEYNTVDVLSSMDLGDNAKERAEDLLYEADGFYSHFADVNDYLRSDVDLGFGDDVKAAVLSDNIAANDFFSSLKKSNPDLDRFIVVTENHGLKGRFHIALSRYGYENAEGFVFPDSHAVNAVLTSQADVGLAVWPFFYDKEIAEVSVYISRYYPGAKIMPVSIKDLASNEEIDAFARKLAGIYNNETVMILPESFSEVSDGRVRDFHNDFNLDVLMSLDSLGIEQMDVSDKKSVSLLFSYLKAIGAEFSENKSDAIVLYKNGERVSEREPMILAFGDMMLGRYVRTLMDRHGENYIFEKMPEGIFEAADIVFGNLEGPIKGDGFRSSTSMVFGFPEWVAPLLSKYGFTLMMIANNHAVDQGWDGRDTTITALEAEGIGWCGHPSEVDAESVYFQKIGEQSVGFMCFHDVTFSLDDEAAVKMIERVAPTVDYLVISAHWGAEYGHVASNASQVEPGRAWIDAGADFVIGHHPHVVQNFEIYNGKFIFYSLGNFVFDQYWSEKTQEELALGIVLNENATKVSLFPMKSEMSQSRLMNSEEYNEWIERFIGYGEYSEEVKNQIRKGVIELKM